MKDMKTIVTHLCIITATLLSLSGCSDFWMRSLKETPELPVTFIKIKKI